MNRIPLPVPRHGRQNPDGLALLWDGVAVSYASLAAQADDIALRLAHWVKPGDRVAVRAPNGPEYVALVHAVPRLGGMLVHLNTRHTAAELEEQLGYVAPKVVVGEVPAGALPSGAQNVALTPGVGVPWLDEVDPAPVALHDYAVADDPTAVVFTSGTGGRARGVILTHGNLIWSALGSALRLGCERNDRWLAPLPLFHMGGLSIVARSALYGTAVVLQPGFQPAVVADSLRRDEVTLVSLVPTMLRRLLEAWDGPAPPSLRAVLLGGGALSATLLEDAAAAGFPIAPSYGLTEAASQVATAPPGSVDGSGGLPAAPPMPFTTLAINADDAPAAPGVEGEILVRGPTVMPGYFGRPGATAQVLRDGWLHTGDMGYLDAAGRLVVTGRRRDRIVTGGENVAPAQVEAAIESHPDVVESCVVGVPDPEWGAVVAAAVVRRPGAQVEAEELEQYLRGRLAGYKLPRQWRWVDALPRTASGKVLREEVGNWFDAPG